jgi:hypothetical protein
MTQGRTVKRVAKYPPPRAPPPFMASCTPHFPDALNVAVAMTEGHRQRTENYKYHQALYIEKCFKVTNTVFINKYLFTKYFTVSA